MIKSRTRAFSINFSKTYPHIDKCKQDIDKKDKTKIQYQEFCPGHFDKVLENIPAGIPYTFADHIERAVFINNPFRLPFIPDPVPRIKDFFYPVSESHSCNNLLKDTIYKM